MIAPSMVIDNNAQIFMDLITGEFDLSLSNRI